MAKRVLSSSGVTISSAFLETSSYRASASIIISQG
jgi:hypothetical protein